jgi:alkylhydroperoxidase family enzyme
MRLITSGGVLAGAMMAHQAGVACEYKHHAPDFLTAGGIRAELDALNTVVKADACQNAAHPALGEVEQVVIRYAAQMTLDVKVTDDVFDALREHFDTAGLVELTSSISTYITVARFPLALGVSPEN